MVIEVPDEFKELVTAVESLAAVVAVEGVRGASGKAVDAAAAAENHATATASFRTVESPG